MERADSRDLSPIREKDVFNADFRSLEKLLTSSILKSCWSKISGDIPLTGAVCETALYHAQQI